MQKCPKCDSDEIYRSRAKSRWEVWRKEITGKRLWRCHNCQWRGWGLESGPKFTDVERENAERAIAPDPPNLKGTSLMREERRPEPVNLKKLDET
jgi:hypothetical protein